MGPRSPSASAHSSQIVTPRSWSHFTLVSPRRNQSSSAKTERVWTFLVVTSGNPLERSNRIWWPKTESVPVPVRSDFSTPSSRTRLRRARDCCTTSNLVAERDLSADRRPGASSHPHRAPHPPHVHAAPAPDGRALRRDVVLGEHRAGEPLAEARVEAAGDRVLGGAVEGPHLPLGVAAPVAPGRDHADVETVEPLAVRVDREDVVRVLEEYADPARAVVEPPRVDDVVGADPERFGDRAELAGGDRPLAQQRRGLEGEPVRPLDRQQAGLALLDHGAAPRRTARFEPG